ncbi:hypothetical protein [Anaerobranca gottschalkii]|uniref:Uncharacterized protein n=1 Tax=Anaerobranca gottschalkii DSM 13577 TaxID=1120990 RepID=A0A1H9Z4R1_9FIRM|nr:hypothetical protein [Anaerobranca gottschalkii]SES75863.1 hypothetical protein SAMN03080614_100638 [Anaerobranca gottschalkii DSM 13577]
MEYKDWDELKKVDQMLKNMEKVEVPIDLTARIVKRAKEQGLIDKKPKKRTFSTLVSPISRLSKISLTAACILYLILSINLLGLNFWGPTTVLEKSGQYEIARKNLAIDGVEDYSQIESEIENTNIVTKEKDVDTNIIIFLLATGLSIPYLIEVIKIKKNL